METNLEETKAICSVKRRYYFSGNLSTVRMSLFEDEDRGGEESEGGLVSPRVVVEVLATTAVT